MRNNNVKDRIIIRNECTYVASMELRPTPFAKPVAAEDLLQASVAISVASVELPQMPAASVKLILTRVASVDLLQTPVAPVDLLPTPAASVDLLQTPVPSVKSIQTPDFSVDF